MLGEWGVFFPITSQVSGWVGLGSSRSPGGLLSAEQATMWFRSEDGPAIYRHEEHTSRFPPRPDCLGRVSPAGMATVGSASPSPFFCLVSDGGVYWDPEDAYQSLRQIDGRPQLHNEPDRPLLPNGTAFHFPFTSHCLGLGS